jgi:hypothetical protein
VSTRSMKRLLSASLAAATLSLIAPPAAAQVPDFDFFTTRVEPIFLEKRPGHARCYACHVNANNAFRLERLAPGSTFWSEEQSRRNYETASRLVAPGNPAASHLLLHPLAPEAGGEPFHSGGRQFTSKDDAEWQVLADWVRRHPEK